MASTDWWDIDGTSATTPTTSRSAAAPVATADWWDVEEDVEEPAPTKRNWMPEHIQQGVTDISRLIDTLQGGLQTTGASSLESEAFRQEDALTAPTAPYRAYNPYGGGPMGTSPSLATPEDRRTNIEQLRDIAAGLREGAAENFEATQALSTSLEDRDAVQRFIGQGAIDALQTPSAVLSIVGGPLGATAIADVYERTYSEARNAGLTHEEADAQAWAQAAPESIAVIPAGKVLEKIPYLGPLLKERAKKVAGNLLRRAQDPALLAGARAAKAVAGESMEEAPTGGMQDVMNSYLAGSAESEASRAFSAERAIAPLDEVLGTPQFWENRGRDVRAAIVMAGAAGTPGAIRSASRDASAQMEENATTADKAIADELAGRRFDAATRQAAPDLDRAVAPEVIEADTAAAEAEAAQLREDQMEADFRNQEIKRRAEQAPESQMAQAFAAHPVWTPELVAAERARAATPAAPTTTGVAPEPTQDVLEPTPAAATEPTPAPVLGKEARNRELGRIHQNRRRAGLDDATYRGILKRVTGKDSAAKLNAAERMAVVDELNKLPDAAPKPKAKAGTVDAELDTMAADLGLDKPLAMASDMEADSTFNPEVFQEKAKGITRSLARSNRQQDVDVLNLINQRKLVIAPNPASIGRGDRTDSTSAAEYDPADGKMYLYTDRANTENVAELLAAAHHESGHAGQFNDREGRPDILRYMLGNKEADNANNRIRKAAESGNRVAQEAVNLARAASGTDTNLEAQELIPYLATAVARNRGKTLGSLRGVWEDINAGLRRFGREKLGMKNLDFDINELMNATTKFAGEAVATDIVGRDATGKPLAMIYNANSKGFQEALERGHVYDSVDGRKKFVLSDADSSISEEQRQKLLAAGKKGVKLGDVLTHDVLYEQVPAARDVVIRVLDSIPNHPTAFAQYDGEDGSINVTRNTVRLKDPYGTSLREAIMHEVQHFVQDNGRYLEEEFYRTRPEHEREIMRYRAADRAAEDASRALLDQVRPISSSLDRTSKTRVMDLLFDRNLSDLDKAARIADVVDEAEADLDFEQQLILDNYRNARQARNDLVPRYNAALTQANNDYVSNITEREAFRTQYDVDVSQSDIDERGNPEPEMREQTSQQRPSTAGRIDVPSQQERLSGSQLPIKSFLDEDTAYLAPGKVEASQLRDNYTKPLGAYSSVMYRDMDADALLYMLPGSTRYGNPGDVYLANTPDLALGQGKNTGYMAEFSTVGLKGRINQAKPTWQFSWDQGQAEFVASNGQPAYQQALQAVTIAPDATASKVDRIVINNTLKRMEDSGWSKTSNDDGSTTYRKPSPRPLAMAAPTTTKAFANWFGDSKIVEEDGRPKPMYRSSSLVSNTFQPNSLGLIFVSPDSSFASAFRGVSTPVYVRAENPWDFSRPEHRAVITSNPKANSAIVEQVQGFNTTHQESERVTPDDALRTGDWGIIELAPVIAAIREAGHDGLYVIEGGIKNLAVFDSNQLKSMNNSGAFSRNTNNIYSMATPTKERKQSGIPTWLKGVFSASQGTGRTINEIVEHARSSPAAARMRAESYMGKYHNALNTVAKQRGISPQVLSENIIKAIDAVDKDSDSYQQNLDAFRKAVHPFGDVGKVLMDMRTAVDALSLDLLRQRSEQAAQGKQLSKAEKKTYTTIMANLGRYAHRQFASNLRDSTYSSVIWNDYLDSKKKGAKLSGVEKANAKRVSNAMKRLVDEIIIPDIATLEEMDADSLTRLHGTWTSSRNPDALSLDEKINELTSMRQQINSNKDLLTAQAETIAQEILGIMPEANPVMRALGYEVKRTGADGGLISQYYRGGKQNRGILKERIEISHDIRELMGEIKDPAMRMFTTAAKQAEFVARTKMLMELSSVNDPYHVQPPGPSGRPEVKGMKQLEGEAYGPLEGYYVSPEMEALIRDTTEQLATFETAVAMAAQRPGILANTALTKALEVWGSIASTTKMLQIVGKPANFLLNFVGGPRMMLMNGNVNPATFTKAWSTAADLIRYARNPAKGGELARRVNAMGVTDSAFIGEINSEQYRELRKVIDSMVGKPPKQVRETIRKAGLTAKESYAMADVMFKIANFYHQADGVLPAYYKAAGIKKTQEEIDREAADIVSRTNITYKRAMPIIKALERGGITQFGTYFSEVFRTEVANVRQGIDELKRAKSAPTPKAAAIMRAQAAKRLGGQLLSWTLTAAATKALGAAAFGDDEEDKYKRYLLPDYVRNQDFIIAGKDKDGAQVLFEWSRFDPAGPATDIMRRIMNDEVGPQEVAEEIFSLYIAPRIGTRLVTAGAATLGLDERAPGKPITQQLFPSAYEGVLSTGNALGLSDRATQAWTTVGETFLPGVVDSLKPNAVAPKAEDPFSAVASAMRYGGAVMYKTDPKRQLQSAAFDYKDVLSRERKLLSELVDNRPNLDVGTALSKVSAAKAKELEAFMELRNIYRGMEAADIPEEEISAVMKQAFERKVSVEVASQIRSGEFQSQVVSEESFEALKKNALKKLPEEKREAAAEQWDEVWSMLNGIEEETNE